MKKILIVLSIFFIAFFTAFAFCNFKIIRNGNIGMYNIDENNIEVSNNDNKTTVTIKAKNNKEYINKLFFNYNTDTNVDWTMKINYYNVYGLDDQKTVTGRANSVINIFEEKLDLRVSDLSIEFEKEIDVNNFQINNKIDFFSNYTIFFVILAIDILIIYIYRKKLKDKIEYLFAILALSGGIAIILMHPFGINMSWDDQIHFENIYGLSNKYYTVSGVGMTDALSFGYFMFNTKTENKEFINYMDNMNSETTTLKAQKKFSIEKLTYMPSAIVLKVSNILHLPFSLAFALGKLIILLIYVAVIFFAIRITPKFKYLMMVIGLVPVELFLASNYSYDAPIVAFSLLGFALFFKELISKEKINGKRVIGIIVSFIIASCAKAIYCPLLLLLLFFPKEKFETKKQRYTFGLLLILVFILMMSTFLMPMLTHEMHSDPRGGDTSIGGQIKLIIHAPLSFIEVAYNNIVLQFFDKFFSTSTLYDVAYMKAHSSSIAYYLLLMLMFLSVYINDKKDIKLNKVIISLILVMIIGMIWGSMYLAFSPVGSVTMNGVQGRYFIPLLLPLLLLIYTPKIKCEIEPKKIYLIYSIGLLFITFSQIYECIL